MYRIRGADQKVYGPVSGEVVRRCQPVRFVFELRGAQHVAISARIGVVGHDLQHVVVLRDRVISASRFGERRCQVVERDIAARVDVDGPGPQRDRVAPILHLLITEDRCCDENGGNRNQPYVVSGFSRT